MNTILKLFCFLLVLSVVLQIAYGRREGEKDRRHDRKNSENRKDRKQGFKDMMYGGRGGWRGGRGHGRDRDHEEMRPRWYQGFQSPQYGDSSSESDERKWIQERPSSQQEMHMASHMTPQMAPEMNPHIYTHTPPEMNPNMDLHTPPEMNPHMDPHMPPDMNPHKESYMPPDMNPHIDPHLSPDMNPHMSPRLPPRMSPHMWPHMSPAMGPEMSPDKHAYMPAHTRQDVNPDMPPDERPHMPSDMSPHKYPHMHSHNMPPYMGPDMSPHKHPHMHSHNMPPFMGPDRSPDKRTHMPAHTRHDVNPDMPPDERPHMPPGMSPHKHPHMHSHMPSYMGPDMSPDKRPHIHSDKPPYMGHHMDHQWENPDAEGTRPSTASGKFPFDGMEDTSVRVQRRKHGGRRQDRRRGFQHGPDKRRGLQWDGKWGLEFGFTDSSAETEEDSFETGFFDGFVPPGRFNFGIGPQREPWFHMGFDWGDDDTDEQWWTGPNVCESREEKLAGSPGEISTFSVFRSYVCTSSETAYSCTTKKLTPRGELSVTETFHCCSGFSRTEGVHGCKQEVPRENISATLDTLGMDSMKSLLDSTGIAHEIFADSHLNFTIFSPTNEALEDLWSAVNQDEELKNFTSMVMVSREISEEMVRDTSNILLGHILLGTRTTSTFSNDQLLETASPLKTSVRINRYSHPVNVLTANCVKITRPDNMASNGVLHVLEKPLFPVTDSLLDFVSKNPELTTMKTLIGLSKMASVLRESGHMTLLAPTDDAFKRHAEVVKKLLSDPKCATKVLKSHLLQNVVCSAAIQGDTTATNMLSKYVKLTRNSDDLLYIDGALVITKDVMATNGVLHVIDDVIIPEEALGLLKLAERRGLTAFTELVEKAGLSKELSNMDGVTMFIPSNEAVQVLPRMDAKMLSNMIRYHVVKSVHSMSSLHNNVQMETAFGGSLRFNEYSSFPFDAEWSRTVHCVPVQSMATEGCNGVFYVVDKSLTPPVGNVLDVLSRDRRFSTLIGLLKVANLSDTLQSRDPLTIFAPTNEAFERLGSDAVIELRDNPLLLRNTLLSHVTSDFVCCAGIVRYNWLHSQHVQTMSGEVYSLGKRRDGSVNIDNKKVTQCDLMGSNGVVHVLDDVLMESDQQGISWDSIWQF